MPGIKLCLTVDEDGVLYFISVQAPPLIVADGSEDYIISDLMNRSVRRVNEG